MKSTVPRNQTAHIKDLELQIDYLIGYRPSGNHWKMEYHIRQTMLDDTLCDPATPQEVVDKINRIQDTLMTLYAGTRHEQGYIKYAKQEQTFKKREHPPIKTYRWVNNVREEYYLE